MHFFHRREHEFRRGFAEDVSAKPLRPSFSAVKEPGLSFRIPALYPYGQYIVLYYQALQLQHHP